MQSSLRLLAIITLSAITIATACSAQLSVTNSFTTPTGLVSLGFSDSADRLWTYDIFGSTLRNYTRSGSAGATVPRGGEAANDVDIDVTSVAMTLGSQTIPAGTILFINGETGATDIYAIDPSTGKVIAGLKAQFGLSHTVGGAYHPGRKTIFLVQDRVPAGASNKSVIAEIDPTSGAVISSFQLAAPFTVNYGDIDINSITGNLFVVSSDIAVIRELTPTGTLVKDHALPAGVNGLSGIGIDEGRSTIWVCGGRNVWELGGWQSPSAVVYGTPTTGNLLYSWRVPPPAGLPRIGHSGFSVQVDAPGLANPGFVLLSAAPADFKVLSIRVLIDLNLSFTIPTPVVIGSAIALPIPATLAPGTRLYLQSFHFDTGAANGIASTKGLRLTLFP